MYQSYGDRMLNHRSMSIGASGNSTRVYSYFTRFYSSSDFFLSGHECASKAYEAAYAAFAGAASLNRKSLQYGTLSSARGSGVEVSESVSDGYTGPWATRRRRATPLGRTTATQYTLGTNLSIPEFDIHSPATGTNAFVASESFTPWPSESRLSEGVSLLMTVSWSATLSVSFVAVNATSMSVVELLTVGDSVTLVESSGCSSLSMVLGVTIETQSVTVVDTVIMQTIEINVWLPTSIKMTLFIMLPTEQEKKKASNATLIGVVTGVAVILVGFAAGAIYLIRSSRMKDDLSSDQDAPQVTRSGEFAEPTNSVSAEEDEMEASELVLPDPNYGGEGTIDNCDSYQLTMDGSEIFV
jgi:hypothetical protein